MRVSPDQVRKALADLLADPEAFKSIFPALAPVFPVQGGACSGNKTSGQIAKFCDAVGGVDDSVITESSGNIGIGTTAPNALLRVKVATTTDPVVKVEGANQSDGLSIKVVYPNAVIGFALAGGTAHLVTTSVQDDACVFAAAGKNLLFALGDAEKMRIAASGYVGIGTTTPSGKVHVVATAADLIALILQAAASQSVSIQQWRDSSGNVRASVTKDGSLVFRGTETKQVSGGPELITALVPNDDEYSKDKVVLWCGLGTGTGGSADTEARFLFSLRGFLEWGPGGTGDQDVALYRNGAGGGISIGNFFTNGPPVHSTDTFRVNAPSKNPPGAEGTAVLGVATGKTAGVRVRGRRSFTLAAGQTVATTETSATVVGTGTAFLSDIVAGDIITIVDTGETKTVKSVTDDTHLVADSAFSNNETSSNMAVASFTGFADSESIQTTAAVTTTDGTAKPLFALTLVDGRIYHVSARVIGRKSDGSERAFYWRAALAYRQGSGAQIQGSIVRDVVTPIESTNATGWDATIALDAVGAPNDVLVQVTGASSITVHWVGAIEIQSVATSA